MDIKQRKKRVPVFILILLLLIGSFAAEAFAAMDVTGAKPVNNEKENKAAFEEWRDHHEGAHSAWDKPGSGFTVDAEYSNRISSTQSTAYSAFGTTCPAREPVDLYNDDFSFNIERPRMTDDNYYAFDITKNTEGKCGIWARNLQIWDNQRKTYVKLDCKITIVDWEDDTKDSPKSHHIAIQKSARSSIELAGMNEAKIVWDYYLSGTDTSYDVKSNLTFDDIDARQYIGFDSEQVEGQFVHEDTHLSYKYESGMNLYYNPDPKDYASGDSLNAIGVAFNTSTLTFSYGCKNDGAWSHFGYLSYAMFRPTPNDPVKYVSDLDEHNRKQVLLSNRDETITYTVRQVVSDGYAPKTYMKSFVMEDTLEDCLEVLDAKVMQGTAESKNFTIDISGQKVTAAATNAALNTAGFYNKVYDLVIEAKIKDGITEEELAKYMDDSIVTIPNTATVTIDDVPRTTDEVLVKEWEAAAKKAVSDEDETMVTSNTLRSRLQTFTYDVYLEVPELVDTLSKLEFTDTLEDCLTVKNVTVMEDNNSVSAGWNIVTEGNKVTATAKNPGADFAGKTYSLRITAQIKFVSDDVLAQHGHFSADKSTLNFKNIGAMTYCLSVGKDIQSQTNEVDTTVKLPVDIQVTKDVNRYEHQVGDPIYYTVKAVHNTKDCDASDIVIKDTDLEHFDLDLSSAKVTGVKDYTLEAVDGGWKFTTEKMEPGQEVTIDFTAKAKKILNGTTPVNTAALKCFGVPEKQDSEEIYVNSPKLKLTKKAERSSYKVGDTIDYELELSQINQGCFMRDVIFTDLIKTDGVNIIPGTIIVLDKNGKDVTGTMDVTIKNNTFTVKTGRNFSDSTETIIPKTKGKSPYDKVDLTGYLKICYSAKAADDNLSGMQVVNYAELPTRPNTNDELIKNDSDIPSGGTDIEQQVPIVGAELRITKESDKKTYEVGETGAYTLKVDEIREDYTAKNVVIKDSFNLAGVKLLPDSFVVKHERKDVTENCGIQVTDQGFEIQTGIDLAYNDTITVTYDAVFESEALTNQTVTNVAQASADNAREKETENTVGLGDWLAQLAISKVSDQKEYEVGDTIHYTLDVSSLQNTAEKVVIGDTIKTAGVELKADTIKVTCVKDGAESDLTGSCRIKAEKTGFTIETGQSLAANGEHLYVTYDAVIKDKTLAGSKVDNFAVTSADNTPKAETPYTVDVLPLAKLAIEKTSDQKVYTVSSKPVYTVKATSTERTAKNVVITDTIKTTGVKILAGSVTVTGPDGKDITGDCRIKAEESDLTIETGKNLQKGESITVTYTAEITDKNLAGKQIDNLAAAAGDNADPKDTEHQIPIKETADHSEEPKENDTPEKPDPDFVKAQQEEEAAAITGDTGDGNESDSNDSKSINDGSVPTGDSFPVGILLVLVTAAAAIMVYAAARRKTGAGR